MYIPWFMNSLTHSLTNALTHKYTHSLTNALTHLLIHSPIHSYIPPFIHSPIYLLIHSFIGLFTSNFIFQYLMTFILNLRYLEKQLMDRSLVQIEKGIKPLSSVMGMSILSFRTMIIFHFSKFLYIFYGP